MRQIVTLSNEVIYSLKTTPFTSPNVYSSELNGFIMDVHWLYEPWI